MESDISNKFGRFGNDRRQLNCLTMHSFNNDGFVFINRLDVVPLKRIRAVLNSALEHFDRGLSLIEPAEHRDQVNKQESRRQQEISQALANVKSDHHRQEKNER